MTSKFERDHIGQYKSVRTILKGNPPEIDLPPAEQPIEKVLKVLFLCAGLAVLALMFRGCNSVAFAYTDEQYVEAIGHAEGVWNYGIKTIKCDSKESCKKIALRTVHNNRIRFSEYGHRHFQSFLQFLGSRYCPTTGGDLSPSEIRLNGNWVKNVSFFLGRENA